VSLKEKFYDHLKSFHTAPFLFVGSGISRRYLELEDWKGLLRRFSKLTDRPYEYFRASGGDHEAAIASEIACELHGIWWSSPDFKDSREKYKHQTINRQSALKIEIARYIESSSRKKIDSKDLQQEIKLLPKVGIDGIITTNWDLFLDDIFPDFRVFIGQEELLSRRF